MIEVPAPNHLIDYAAAQAAAVKYVGAVPRIPSRPITAATATSYEVTVTKFDGSAVEVNLDSPFDVMHGPGSHGGVSPFGGPGPSGGYSG